MLQCSMRAQVARQASAQAAKCPLGLHLGGRG